MFEFVHHSDYHNNNPKKSLTKVGEFLCSLLSRLFITVDNSYKKQYDCNHDQYVDESTHSIWWHQSEYPEDEQDDSNCFEHMRKDKYTNIENKIVVAWDEMENHITPVVNGLIVWNKSVQNNRKNKKTKQRRKINEPVLFTFLDQNKTHLVII